MIHSGMRRIAWLTLAIFLIPLPALCEALESAAYFYGSQPPVNELAMFSKVVVEPDHLSDADMQRLQSAGSLVFAYISIGETGRERSWYIDTRREWEIGENRAWNSAVMDMTNIAWQEFILERLVKPLSDRGYDGLFLDTLDSYRLITDEPEKQKMQEKGLADFISRLHQRFPGMKILLNRGFEVIPDVHDQVDGIVAESLFQRWDPAKRIYTAVPEEDRRWLKETLQEIHTSYRLPVHVIDYVDPANRNLARETARKIEDLGFTPWVTNASLDMLGISTLEIVPRRMMVLYDSRESQLPYSQPHRYLAAPLEYMGYVVEYADVSAPLPENVLTGRYAGLISWITGESGTSSRSVTAWLSRQMDEGMPVAFLGSFGVNPSTEFLARLGLEAVNGKIARPVRIVSHDKLSQMEARPRPLFRGLFMVRAVSGDVQVHASIADANNRRMDVIMTAPWGGVALSPYVLEKGIDDRVRWRLDIFRFLSKALRLQSMPRFDTTTENGLRLLMAHIDGDGVASRAVMPGTPLAIRVIRDEILKKYPLPVTVSVIAGEFENSELYPDRVAEMRRIARSIFAMEQVEIASHSYSHPFDWEQAAFDPKSYLQLPGYLFSRDSEVTRSVKFIDEKLAPPGKKTSVFLWSGNALPDENDLRLVRSLGLRNMNGGNTVMTSDYPSITDVSGMARPVGNQLQVYAPIMNESLYTNSWTKPRYGFQRVIETFKLTGTPRRLKPIDIYYHFYSGTETASIKALKEVYDWSMKQRIHPVHVGEYCDKVEAYMQAAVARRTDGSWIMLAPDAIRTVRIPESMGWPDIKASSGVAGVLDLPQGRYLHLAPAGKKATQNTLRHYLLNFNDKLVAAPYLVSANGRLERWQVEGNRIRMHMRGYLPLHIAMNRPCTLQMAGKSIEAESRGMGYEFSLKQKDTGDALLICR